jgi:hypothetical protein
MTNNTAKDGELLLQTLTPEGDIPESRIADPEAAKRIYDVLWDADRVRRRNRAEIQAMLDGVPPYDEEELRATGQADRANINFGEGESLLESAMAGYVDLLNSVERLVSFKTTFGDPSQRYEWEQIISEEMTRMLRNWPRYTSQFLLLANHFVGHGVGVLYFDDEVDWRWKVSGLGDFLIPNRTFACEEDVEVAIARRSYQVHQLYAFIKDEEIATAAGWNVPETRKAIINAVNAGASSDRFTDWEELRAQLKNNDLTLGYAGASEVKVIHLWNREFNGSISHLVSLEDGSNEEFLCKRIGPFKNVSEAFTIFTFGVGTNGYYHSIRGLGYKIYPQIQASNRLRCQFFDGSMLSSSLMVQPESEDALNDLNLFYYGPYSILPPKMKIIERAVPNLANNVVPMLADLNATIQNKTGAYQTTSATPSGKERTKFEVQAQLAQGAKLSSAALNLFYEPWQRHLKEVVRRIVRPLYLPTEPGGDEVARFIEKCVNRGVPVEAIYAIDLDTVVAVKAIGAGSETSRLLAFEDFMQMMSAFDDTGKRNVLRDRVAARVGYDQVNRYIPPIGSENRPLPDEKVAELENNSMQLNQVVTVKPNENHFIHARVHSQLLAQMMQRIDQGQMSLEQAVQPLVNLVQHQTQHVQSIQVDVSIEQDVALLRQQLQQAGEFTYNGMEKLKRQQQDQQIAALANPTPQEGQPAMDPLMQQKMLEHQLKLQMMQEQFTLQQQMKLEESRQKLAIEDARAARKMAAENNLSL